MPPRGPGRVRRAGPALESPEQPFCFVVSERGAVEHSVRGVRQLPLLAEIGPTVGEAAYHSSADGRLGDALDTLTDWLEWASSTDPSESCAKPEYPIIRFGESPHLSLQRSPILMMPAYR